MKRVARMVIAASAATLVLGALPRTAHADGVTEIFGGPDADFIHYSSPLPGHAQIWAGAGEDRVLVDQLPTVDLSHKFHANVSGPASLVTGREAVRARDMVDADGQDGADLVEVGLTGTSDYIVRVADTGNASDGGDRLMINGPSTGALSYLIRERFVAALPTAGPSFASGYERVNYEDTMELLAVTGGTGDDQFFADGTLAEAEFNGGDGADSFSFGQLFGAPRTSMQVAPQDEAETVETTDGWLTPGVGALARASGGAGGDRMQVWSNNSPLSLDGNSGDDVFEVRAFELVANGGPDTNAPVTMAGSEGADSLLVVGTDGADTFTISDDRVQGAGLDVTFSGIETLVVDGLGGDDQLTVLQAPPDRITIVVGGNGVDDIVAPDGVAAEDDSAGSRWPASGARLPTELDTPLPSSPLAVATDDQTIVHGDADPVFEPTYAGGLRNGDTQSSPPATCGVAGPHTDAGSYTVTCSTADARYLLTSAPAVLTVFKATTTLIAAASNGGFALTPVTDTASLEGIHPTGSMKFHLYGAADDACAEPPVFTSTVPVNGNGGYTSDPFTPLAPGTYRWVASYSGDGNHVVASGVCNDANQSVTVKPPVPTSLVVAPVFLKLGPTISLTIGRVSARLSSGGSPVSNQTVAFRAGSLLLCTATTNSQGVASCSPRLGGLVGVLLRGRLSAHFAGNVEWTASSGEGGFIG